MQSVRSINSGSDSYTDTSSDFHIQAPRASLASSFVLEEEQPVPTINVVVVDDDHMFLNVSKLFLGNYFGEWEDVKHTLNTFSNPNDALEYIKVPLALTIRPARWTLFFLTSTCQRCTEKTS